MAIKRIWHGWTTPHQAAAYKELLRTEIFPGIEAKKIAGYQGIELLTRDHGDEIEFITIMTFASIEDVIAFQGSDYQQAYVPTKARNLLERWDRVSSHYEVLEARTPARIE